MTKDGIFILSFNIISERFGAIFWGLSIEFFGTDAFSGENFNMSVVFKFCSFGERT